MKPMLAMLALLALSIQALGHRLDEYLQATRIALAPNQITLSIDLTPGVAIIEELRPFLHPTPQDRIPHPEQKAYARRVLDGLQLELDGKPRSLRLSHATFSPWADLQAGEGTIRLIAVARFPTLTAGPHEMILRNHHLPKISVYLVNALLPKTGLIQITHQTRDELQKDYRLDFDVSLPTPARLATKCVI